jgi:hypothetical protein
MSLEAVTKVTKIQPRILERLEAGQLDGLPAEVFVRGFVRSFARCVGLDEDEALRRYAACGLAAGTGDLTPTVRALVEAMVDLAPGSTSTPRATPRRMQAVEGPEIIEIGSPGLPIGAVVETMMLPETGTVVMPVQLMALAAEATPRPIVTEAVIEAVIVPAPGARSAGSLDARPVTEHAEAPVTSESIEPVVSTALAIEPVGIAAGSDGSKKKRGRRGKGRNKRAAEEAAGISRDRLATGTPHAASPIVAADVERPAVAQPAALSTASGEPITSGESIATGAAERSAAAVSDEPIATETWAPKMPPIAAAPSVPWRRPAYAASPVVAVPSLVIDDADPDSAERVLEERAETFAPRRSFLPPILLDREDRSTRQGGLTLAVIILLIAATLTLSYLMRRPSASGDGMTRLETPASDVDSSSRSDARDLAGQASRGVVSRLAARFAPRA